MLKFTRAWVNDRMDGLWEEMVGIRPTLRERMAGQDPPTTVNPGVDIDYAEEWLPYSELNAARIIQLQMGNHLTYTGDDKGGHWYFWNGVYHQEIASGIVGDWIAEAFTDQIVTAMDWVDDAIRSEVAAREAAGTMQKSSRADELKMFFNRFKDHKAYQRKLHSDAGLNALKSRLRKQCTVEPDYFDEDRQWLVCMNGVIDLEMFRQGHKIQECFFEHSPFRPVTRAVQCDFNPDAKAPTWEHFLETSQPDPELREFLQRLVGAAFLAEGKVKAIPNLVGPKDSGKSMFVTILDKLAGGYGAQPAPSALMKQKGGGTNWEQESLRGKRFVGITEPSPTDVLDDTFCKQVTGGDVVHTRMMYTNSTGWRAQCVIFIASNHHAKLNTQDQAFLERMCFIKFPYQFFDATEAPDGEIHIKDPDLERKLEAEYEGIFLWVIIGMWKYLWYGIGKPDSVSRAGDSVAVEASSALTWIREKVEEGLLEVAENVSDHPLSHYALLGKLFDAYKYDMINDGEYKHLKKHAFSRHLQNYYGEQIKSGGVRVPKLVGVGAWSHMHMSGSTSNHTF